MKIWINGELLEKDQAKISVLDHGLLYGDGVFEGIRAYNGTIFQCQAHLDRLYASAKTIDLPIAMAREDLTEAMYETLRANDIRDGYIRLLVTRGIGTLGLNPFECSGGSIIIIADQIALYPPEMYQNGLEVIIAEHVRISPNMLPPAVKSMNYLNNILANIEATKAGVGEAIMLNAAGEVAEATGDNIFIVQNGVVATPPPEAGILVGITRKVVCGLCEKLGISLQERRIAVEELFQAEEIFLTGTAAEVIAVTKVNGRVIGEGKAGPVTLKLLKAFRDFIRRECGG